ncbi:asparaginase [Micromonospora sp. WMMD1102]|uniref:asparaginase n=1 Tax=Micromonospora sp. WMMD1102 TaxID=3016105 RepID=UPI00241593BD|nr:asparaginase [Micromonospora sp. WMMD1102]MDG4786652.1 asparaginase [Micromonospora sp. WMMD1102]
MSSLPGRLRPTPRRLAAVLVPVLTAALTATVVSVLHRSPEPAAVALPPISGTVSGVTGPTEIRSVEYGRAVAAAKAKKPRVTVIGTGGTISGVATSRSSFTDYQSGRIAIGDLVARLQPEIGQVADVSTVQFGNKGSGGYTIAEFHALTLAVEAALKKSDAVVVTSGTDTMEEFAYWLDLTVRSRKPVVLTGAMRPWAAVTPDGPQVIGADGPANLYNSIVLAASQSTYCYGTVLMLGDEFHAARDVTKTSSYRMDTFQSRELGVLGWVDGPNIKVGRAPARVADCDAKQRWLTPFDLSTIAPTALPRVEVVYGYQQAGGEAITAFADAGVKGIVTAGTGAGGISSAQSSARTAAAAKGVVFVSTTRTGSGSVYGGSTSAPIIAGEDLLPQKARLLLILSLAFAPTDLAKVRGWVGTLGNPEWHTAPKGNPKD